MKKSMMIVGLLFITGIATTGAKYADNYDPSEKMYNSYKEKQRWANSNSEEVSRYLKNTDLLLKDYKKIDSVLNPLIRKAMLEYYGDSIPYALTEEDFALCIQTIATSEGSAVSKRGILPFKSPLFIKGNNPFGIQGKGMVVKTFEYIGGEKKVMYLPFRRFDTFYEGILHIFDLFENARYKRLKDSENGTEFFYDLKECGYFTSPHHHKTFFIPHFYKLKRIG